MQRQAGFSYVLVMFTVASLSILAVRILDVAATKDQRAREEALLYVGNAYREAIGAYYENTPGTSKQFPEKLTDLLQDPRTTVIQRALRKLYRDPITSDAVWGLVRGDDERIMGVYSLSTQHPIKTGGFTGAQTGFAGASQYRNWRFVYAPAASLAGRQ